MRDVHQVVVNNIREMVSWEPIILNDHLVIDHTVVKLNFAVHHVFKLRFAFGDLHPNDEGLTVGLLFCDLLCVIALDTEAVIFGFGIFLAA